MHLPAPAFVLVAILIALSAELVRAQAPSLVTPVTPPPPAETPEETPAEDPPSVVAPKVQREATYRSPKPVALDVKQIGLMQLERDKFATFLSSFVSNELGAEAAAGRALAVEAAEKLIAISLMLAPRNRRAAITDYQLSRGLAPNEHQMDYEPEVLAELLIKRAELLREQGGEVNAEVAALLSFAAVEVDPRNEDAIFVYQMHLRDGKGPDWEFYLGDRAAPVDSSTDPTDPTDPSTSPFVEIPRVESSATP